MRKARLLCLTDKYEYDLISSIGKSKEDYIGQVGSITHAQKMLTGNGSATNLFDITFEDGAMFCVNREQIEFVEGFEETK